MVDLKDRARRPRIRTAAELAARLDNVRPLVRGQYQFTADAPCHTTKNPGHGDSFHFRYAPGDGIVIDSWNECTGREMAERIEDRRSV